MLKERGGAFVGLCGVRGFTEAPEGGLEKSYKKMKFKIPQQIPVSYMYYREKTIKSPRNENRNYRTYSLSKDKTVK